MTSPQVAVLEIGPANQTLRKVHLVWRYSMWRTSTRPIQLVLIWAKNRFKDLFSSFATPKTPLNRWLKAPGASSPPRDAPVGEPAAAPGSIQALSAQNLDLKGPTRALKGAWKDVSGYKRASMDPLKTCKWLSNDHHMHLKAMKDELTPWSLALSTARPTWLPTRRASSKD